MMIKKDRTANLIAVARGDLRADVLLINAQLINVFTSEIEKANIAIYGDKIAGIGPYKHGKQIFDLNGQYVAPGFIDGHTHIESSMLHIAEYARAVVPHGTTGVVTDLHEIANVTGLAGVKYMMGWARRLPLSFYFMVPSCVPATNLETSGASLGAEDIKKALKWKGVIGLGEMMNFPGVVSADTEVIKKIQAAAGKPVDGHAPALGGLSLNAYIAPGIFSDHESTTLEEAKEKLARGMYVMIREGSSEKNLEALLPLVNNKDYCRCFFVIDDRSCSDLKHEGDMDAVIRKAIKCGLEPVRAIQMATLSPTCYFGLQGVGAVAPGYFADLVTIDNLQSVSVDLVFYRGNLVAREGRSLFSTQPLKKKKMTNTFHVKPLKPRSLVIPEEKKSHPVIEVIPGQIVTKKVKTLVKVENNCVVADTINDILKLAVIERHKRTGNIGLGMVKGFGLKKGALASSIAHDSHNIVVVGTNDDDMLAAVKEIIHLKGGLVVAAEGKVVASLPLPVAGLLSLEPLDTVIEQFEEVEAKALELGCTLPSPFATLSFLALPVIPELRVTDMGLVDVPSFKILD